MAAADGDAEGGGLSLGDNLSVQAARANWLYHSRRYQARVYLLQTSGHGALTPVNLRHPLIPIQRRHP